MYFFLQAGQNQYDTSSDEDPELNSKKQTSKRKKHKIIVKKVMYKKQLRML